MAKKYENTEGIRDAKEKNYDKGEMKEEVRRSIGQGRILAGTIIIIVGAGLLLQNLFPKWFSFNYAWPLIIIAVGLFLIMRKRR